MQLLLVAVGCVPVLLGIALFSALRIAIDARAVGQENGLWALAFGVEVGPFQLSGVLRSGTPKRFDAHLFGRRLSFGGLLLRRRKAAAQTLAEPGKPKRPRARRLPSWLDPVDAAVFLFDERRHLRIERLELDLDYGFQDVTLTGKLAGALYVCPVCYRLACRSIRIRAGRGRRPGRSTWTASSTSGRASCWPRFSGTSFEPVFGGGRRSLPSRPFEELQHESKSHLRDRQQLALRCARDLQERNHRRRSAKSRGRDGDPGAPAEDRVWRRQCQRRWPRGKLGGSSGGQGAGGAVELEPVAAIAIGKDGHAHLLTVEGAPETAWSGLLSQVPDLLARLAQAVGDRAQKELSERLAQPEALAAEESKALPPRDR